MTQRVLVISPKISGIGGVAQHVSKLVQLLSDRGFEVDVLSCENVFCIRRRGMANPSFMVASSLKVLFDKRKYDVIHAHNVPSALAMRLANGKVKILTLHGVFSEQVEILHGSAIGYVSELLEKLAFKWADKVTVVSRQTLEYYRKKYGDKKLFYIPNAIDLRDLPREKRRLFEKQVVYLGRLSWEKGVDVLVRAASIMKNIDFIIIGDGPLRERLEKMATNNVHFMGFMERSEALKIVAGSDVYVQPSLAEGLSTSLLEAMALGVPVVASRVGGNIELVENEVTGLLFEPGDIEGLVKTLKRVLFDKKLASSLARRGRELVIKRFSWDVVFEKYLKVYEF